MTNKYIITKLDQLSVSFKAYNSQPVFRVSQVSRVLMERYSKNICWLISQVDEGPQSGDNSVMHVKVETDYFLSSSLWSCLEI
jgi:hypothetical protein